MKVLLVTSIFPPDIGGPATYVPQVAQALSERGHQIIVVTLGDRVDHDDRIYPFRVIRLPRRIFKPWRWLRTVAVLVRLGRRSDVLFVNGLAMEAALANLLLGKPLVQKVVGDLVWERVTNWGWIEDSFEDFQNKRYGMKVDALKALRAWWTRRADIVIIPSRYLARWVARWGVPEHRLVVIYNALDPPNGIQPANVPLSTPVKMVTVGRLVPWKRVDKLLEAIARLDGAGLVIVGDGPERNHLNNRVKAFGIADRVYFAGQRNRRETLSLMAACDVFVLNSSYEGFPHVVLEAMAIGLPVVATAVGGTTELVEDGVNGRLIAASDEGALFQALSGLVSAASERRRLAKEARQTLERFSLRQMVQEVEGVLEKATRLVTSQ